MPKKDNVSLYLQVYSLSPAPSRDYHGLTVNANEVILNTWNVTRGRYVYPKRQKTDLEDFPDDKKLQEDINRIFGDHTTEYILDLATKKPYMYCLPNKILLRIMKMLSSNDVLRLSQTSKIFWELCNNDQIWKIIFLKRNGRPATRDENRQAEAQGWKQILRSKIEKKYLRPYMIRTPVKEIVTRPFTGTTNLTKTTISSEKIISTKEGTVSKTATHNVFASLYTSRNVVTEKNKMLTNKAVVKGNQKETKTKDSGSLTIKKLEELYFAKGKKDTKDSATRISARGYIKIV